MFTSLEMKTKHLGCNVQQNGFSLFHFNRKINLKYSLKPLSEWTNPQKVTPHNQDHWAVLCIPSCWLHESVQNQRWRWLLPTGNHRSWSWNPGLPTYKKSRVLDSNTETKDRWSGPLSSLRAVHVNYCILPQCSFVSHKYFSETK